MDSLFISSIADCSSSIVFLISAILAAALFLNSNNVSNSDCLIVVYCSTSASDALIVNHPLYVLAFSSTKLSRIALGFSCKYLAIKSDSSSIILSDWLR